MGNPEQPVSNKMKYGKLRRYKCLKCGQLFKDYYMVEENRVCPGCAREKEGES